MSQLKRKDIDRNIIHPLIGNITIPLLEKTQRKYESFITQQNTGLPLWEQVTGFVLSWRQFCYSIQTSQSLYSFIKEKNCLQFLQFLRNDYLYCTVTCIYFICYRDTNTHIPHIFIPHVFYLGFNNSSIKVFLTQLFLS